LPVEKLPLFETSTEPVTTVTGSPTVTKTETPVASTQTVAETPVTETKTEAPVTNITPVTETPVTETAKSTGNIFYNVQIGAFTNPAVTSAKLARMYRISENIRSEMAGGFTKFMVGKFDEYKSARNHRETVKGKGVNGAFVTAYNGPVRITVQEALMISNQKWLK
jgi:cell division protein FtsN